MNQTAFSDSLLGLTKPALLTARKEHSFSTRFGCHAITPVSALKRGGSLEQIQLLLGHESIQTTMDYLGVRQDLEDAANDRLRLGD
jgi:site-specific recombinase XerD